VPSPSLSFGYSLIFIEKFSPLWPSTIHASSKAWTASASDNSSLAVFSRRTRRDIHHATHALINAFTSPKAGSVKFMILSLYKRQ
jgi:hypothetical protein